MRDTIENVSQLQKQINDLQLENQILKAILDRSGIPYTQELNRRTAPETVERFDSDQGARIIHPEKITEKMAKVFFSFFWGRQDNWRSRILSSML